MRDKESSNYKQHSQWLNYERKLEGMFTYVILQNLKLSEKSVVSGARYVLRKLYVSYIEAVYLSLETGKMEEKLIKINLTRTL